MKLKKMIISILTIFFAVILLNCYVYAVIDTTSIDINRNHMNEFDPIGNRVFSAIRLVAIVVSVVGLAIIGIRYMTSSVEQKASDKQTLIYYIIGMVLVFSIVNIVAVIYEWLV